MRILPYISIRGNLTRVFLSIAAPITLLTPPLSAAVQYTKTVTVTLEDVETENTQTFDPGDGDTSTPVNVTDSANFWFWTVFNVRSTVSPLSYHDLGLIDTFRIEGTPLTGKLSALEVSSTSSQWVTLPTRDASASAKYTVTFDVTQSGRQANLNLAYSLNAATISWDLTSTDGSPNPVGISGSDSTIGTIDQSSLLDIGSYLLTVEIILPENSYTPGSGTSESIDYVVFEVIAVPEPSSALLMTLGLSSILLRRNRRYSKVWSSWIRDFVPAYYDTSAR